MKTLFLGGDSSRELVDLFPSTCKEATDSEYQINIDFAKSLDDVFIVSYNYYTNNIWDYVEEKDINLDISYCQGAYDFVLQISSFI
ncbi:hypothetical protein [Methanolobus psychrotolerans]|uniref:hypothetical protein n=1 Tax=Methanolobus psychrotolerans TaxID=1874706 RepID=UPI000B9188C7|nr:hypothetical protein [Methanolobus psychrotolerans]